MRRCRSSFPQIGKTFPAEGERRYRVAFMAEAGNIANVAFGTFLTRTTIRVLQKNGCEVVVPRNQTCCGALAVHSGLREQARELARKNIDAVMAGEYDAIITNAAGCGSTLKEYREMLEDDAAYHDKAKAFSSLMKDITEFLASIDLRGRYASAGYERCDLPGFLPLGRMARRSAPRTAQTAAKHSGRHVLRHADGRRMLRQWRERFQHRSMDFIMHSLMDGG